MLALSQVSKCYGDTVALASTDLNVPAGETMVLIGPSGCGKSTLLRLINGLIQPDSGSITFDNTTITPANILQARQQMGYVIQEGGLRKSGDSIPVKNSINSGIINRYTVSGCPYGFPIIRNSNELFNYFLTMQLVCWPG